MSDPPFLLPTDDERNALVIAGEYFHQAADHAQRHRRPVVRETARTSFIDDLIAGVLQAAECCRLLAG